MATNLTDFMQELEATKPGSFSPGAYYYGHEEDSLTLYLRNEESYSHRLNNLVTVFLSLENQELVGCQVKGLRRKLLSDGSFCIAIHQGGKLQLGLFFHLLAFEVQEAEPRNRLIELGQKTKGIQVNTEELAFSC